MSERVDVLNSGRVLIHSLLIHTSTLIKKIALVAEPQGECYQLNFYPTARRKPAGDAIANASTQIARSGMLSRIRQRYPHFLAWLHFRSEVSGLISLVSHKMQWYSVSLAWLYIVERCPVLVARMILD